VDVDRLVVVVMLSIRISRRANLRFRAGSNADLTRVCNDL
jgi:hypothetical protein